MARLTSPTGITVNVSDEKAAQLLAVGYKAVGESESEKKAPAKKATSSSKTSK